MAKENFLKLGEILFKAGILSQKDLDRAIREQRKTGKRLGEVLIESGILKEEEIVKALSSQLGVPYVSKKDQTLHVLKDQKLQVLVPEDVARERLVVPIAKVGNTLRILLADPLDLVLIDNLKHITGCEISPIIATTKDIKEAVDELYGQKDVLKEAMLASQQAASESIDIAKDLDSEISLEEAVKKAGEATIVKLVDLLILEAIKSRASDIHIEPFKNKAIVRYRIDGVLYEISPPSAQLLPSIISRIKILGKLDIAERRLPQDGGFSVTSQDRTIDIRVSSLPTIYGEKIVMRLLDKDMSLTDFARLGLTEDEIARTKRPIQSPYGLIFITGPTGSGKSTTLYAILNKIRTPKKNILTIEDPVEYKLEGINQVQAKPAIGLTFAQGLRAFLRQDPDIIMVGEVRDIETAQICVRAALTGHLVLSTLHTNDAPSAITRLIDLGIAPFLLSPSLLMIVAQRLVRRLCPDCKQPYEATKEELALFDKQGIEIKSKKLILHKAKGCEKCKNAGYYGRIALFEILTATQEIKELIRKNAPYQEIAQQAAAQDMHTLLQSGLIKAREGITTIEEVFQTVLTV